jgi:cytochrome c2
MKNTTPDSLGPFTAVTVGSNSKVYGECAQNRGRDCSNDAEAGRKVFVEYCSMCHSTHPGEKIVGPVHSSRRDGKTTSR